MAEARTARHDHARNGHQKGGLDGAGAKTDAAPESSGAVGGLLKGVADAVTSRIPVADLDERDPDLIRERLPGLWLLSSLYFRGEVRGLGNIPESGPVLL